VEKYCRTRQATDDNMIRRMRFACRILKATDTRSEYVIGIALPQQQWLHERASILRYTYIGLTRGQLNHLHNEDRISFSGVKRPGVAFITCPF
jgi:hypothetical protein